MLLRRTKKTPPIPFTHLFHSWRYDKPLNVWMRPPTIGDEIAMSGLNGYATYTYIGKNLIYPKISMAGMIWVMATRPYFGLEKKIDGLAVAAMGEKREGDGAGRLVTDSEIGYKKEQQKRVMRWRYLLEKGLSIDDIMNMTRYQAESWQLSILYDDVVRMGATKESLSKIDNPLGREPRKAR